MHTREINNKLHVRSLLCNFFTKQGHAEIHGREISNYLNNKQDFTNPNQTRNPKYLELVKPMYCIGHHCLDSVIVLLIFRAYKENQSFV